MSENLDRRVLKVQGRGTVSAEPDRAVLGFGVVGRDPSYSASIEKLNSRVEALRADLEQAGIERVRLKTTKFGVHADYSYEDGKRMFRGYAASHRLLLELPLDRELLDRALDRAARSASEATINISFEVSDRETLRRRTLRSAVEDARESAVILADAAGVTLGEIERIDYGFMEVRVRSSFSYDASMMVAEPSMPDFEPEEVEARENVTVVWRII